MYKINKFIIPINMVIKLYMFCWSKESSPNPIPVFQTIIKLINEFILISTFPKFSKIDNVSFEKLDRGVSINIEVHGTTTLNVGAIVNFSAPVVGAQHSGEKFDKYLSGRYMIKTLKHTFDFSERRHLCAMTLVKDSFNTKLPMHDLAIEPKAEARGIISEFYS